MNIMNLLSSLSKLKITLYPILDLLLPNSLLYIPLTVYNTYDYFSSNHYPNIKNKTTHYSSSFQLFQFSNNNDSPCSKFFLFPKIYPIISLLSLIVLTSSNKYRPTNPPMSSLSKTSSRLESIFPFLFLV